MRCTSCGSARNGAQRSRSSGASIAVSRIAFTAAADAASASAIARRSRAPSGTPRAAVATASPTSSMRCDRESGIRDERAHLGRLADELPDEHERVARLAGQRSRLRLRRVRLPRIPLADALKVQNLEPALVDEHDPRRFGSNGDDYCGCEDNLPMRTSKRLHPPITALAVCALACALACAAGAVAILAAGTSDADAAFRQGRFDRAKSLYAQAVQANPRDAAAKPASRAWSCTTTRSVPRARTPSRPRASSRTTPRPPACSRRCATARRSPRRRGRSPCLHRALRCRSSRRTRCRWCGSPSTVTRRTS